MSLAIFQRGAVCAERKMSKTKDGRRVQPSTVSTDRLDGHGTIILPAAFEETVEDYRANGPLLWSHDSRLLPIGMVDPGSIRVLKTRVDADFVENETGLARQVFDLYESGDLRGFSVGGRIRKAVWSWEDKKKRDDLPKHARDAMEEGDCWATITGFKWSETSACACPSTPGALARALAEGRLAAEYAPALARGEQFVDFALQVAEVAREQRELRSKLDRVFEALCARSESNPEPATESQAENAWTLTKALVETKRYSSDDLRADLRKILAG